MRYVLSCFKFRERATQYLALFGVNLGIFSSGMHCGWPSISSTLLTSGNYTIQMTNAESSMLTLTAPISIIFGSIITAVTMKLVGARRIMLLSAIPLTASWLFLALANSKIYLYIGRALGGFVNGSLFTVGPCYLSEIADPEVRGSFGTSIMVVYALGIAAINLFVMFLSIVSISYMAAAVSFLMLITIPFVPESPYFYVLKGNITEAEVSLQKIKRDQDVLKDLERVWRSVEKYGDKQVKVTDLFTEKHYRKCLLISLVLSTTQSASGNNAIQDYCEGVFQMSQNIISSSVANCIYYVVFFIGTLASPLLVDVFGRKPLLLVSTGFTTLTLFATGTYMYCKSSSELDTSLEPIQLVLLLLITVSVSTGLYSIPPLLTTEFFPPNLVGTVLCITNIVYSVISCSTLLLFQWSYYEYSIGTYVPFYVLSVCGFCAMMLIALFLFETKGKTLEEIQEDISLLLSELNSKVPRL